MQDETSVITSPTAIENFRVRTLRSALKLEILGMTRRGPSVYSIVKKEFGFKGSKQKVLDQLVAYIKENNI
jgi:hypothetical protein